jgi:hypothetical protein
MLYVDETAQCATFDFLTNTLHIPCLNLGTTSYWLDLGLVGYDPITFEIKNFGDNGTPGNASECASFDFLTNTLHIPCFNLEATTYWLDLGLTSYDPVRLQLKDYGEKNSGTPDNQTAEKVVGFVILGQKISNLTSEIELATEGFSEQDHQQISYMKVASEILHIAKSKMPSFNGDIHIAGTESGTEDCSDGGSISYNMSWTGPSYPEDCTDIEDLEMYFTLNNCQEDNMTMNGSFSITYTGVACNPSAFTITLSNFSLNVPSSEIYLSTSQLKFIYTEVQWNGSMITHMKATLDGGATASYKSNDYSVSYDKLYFELDTTNGVDYKALIGGSVTGGCLDGWITLNTIEPVLLNIYEECPTGGKIRITTEREFIVQFYSDGSIRIDNTLYNSCQDLDTSCTN